MEHQIEVGSNVLHIKECWFSGELGSNIWNSAYLMIKYLECNGDLIKNKEVIELGSGTGIAGIAAALLGAKHVTITDIEPLLELMKENIQLNQMESVCEAKVLSWGEKVDNFNPPYEVIILSDVITQIYEEHFKNLIQSMKDLSDKNTLTIMSFEKRMNSKDEIFFKLLDENGFTVNEITVNESWNTVYKSNNRLKLFEIKLK